MPQQSEIVEKLQVNEEKARIISLALMGKQPSQIAKEVGYSRKQVTEILKDALADVSEIMLEQAERLHLINLMRLERLIEAAMPYALGGQPDLVLDPEGELGILTQPDRSYIAEVRQIIKLEMDWEKALYDNRAKNPDNSPDKLDQTLSSQDELYILAQANMETEWMGEFADMTAQDLLPGGPITDEEIDRIHVPKHVKQLEKRIDALGNALKSSGVSDEVEEDE